MTKAAVALAFIALNFYIYQYLATDEVIPARQPFAIFPLQLDDWTCTERERMSGRTLENLGASDYLLCHYSRPEPEGLVGVYIGYHETQVRREGGGGGENSIHPPEHCLPGSGWDIIDSAVVPIDIEGMPEGHGFRAGRREAKRFVIAKGNARQLVYFWYQSRGRVLARNEDVILMRFWDRARSRRTDGSLIRFTVPIVRGDVEGAEENFREVASRMVPLLPEFVPN
jgi:EpsI family protein